MTNEDKETRPSLLIGYSLCSNVAAHLTFLKLNSYDFIFGLLFRNRIPARSLIAKSIFKKLQLLKLHPEII